MSMVRERDRAVDVLVKDELEVLPCLLGDVLAKSANQRWE
jgi:hypothetical protein